MALVSLAPPPPLKRPRVLVLGSVFASAATLMGFAGLLGIYLLQRGQAAAAGGPTLPEGTEIALAQANVMLFGLLMSAVTMQWAVSAVKNDDRQNTYLALGITLLFGIAYINMTAYLWSKAGFVIAEQSQAVLFYAVTAGHVVMTLVAMGFVGLMAFRAFAGEYSSRHHDGIVAAAVFWHAMVAVYCVFWYAIYVMK